MQSPSYPNLPDSALGKIRDRISYNRDAADKVAKTESMRMREVADVLESRGGNSIILALGVLSEIESRLRYAASMNSFANGMDSVIWKIEWTGEVDGE